MKDAASAEVWRHCCHDTPIGRLLLAASPRGVVRIAGVESGARVSPAAARTRALAALEDQALRAGRDMQLVEDAAALRPVARELDQYFAGKRRAFEFELDLVGTEFDCAVWRLERRIQYGRTRTYGQLAGELGKPNAARAVGGATGRNPVLLAVPCHRVLGVGGLGGFSAPGGVRTKKQLLDMESGLFGLT